VLLPALLNSVLVGWTALLFLQALCLACGSDPDKGTAKKMGAYVMKTCFQTTTVSSAMFITAMAANPLAVNLAAAEGINISWGLWALAGLVPGVICLLTVPLILYALFPPGRGTAQQYCCSCCSTTTAALLLVLLLATAPPADSAGRQGIPVCVPCAPHNLPASFDRGLHD